MMGAVQDLERVCDLAKIALADCNAALTEKGANTAANLAEVPSRIAEIESTGGGDAYDKGFVAGLEQGYKDGYEKGALPLTRINTLNNVFNGATFPENYDLVLHLKQAVNMQYCFFNSNVRSVTLIAEQAGDVMLDFCFRNCTNLQVVDMKDYQATITSISYAFYYAQKLKSIYGVLNISGCSNANGAFDECPLLEDIEFAPNTTKVSISFSRSPLLTDKSIQSIIDGLADLTGATAQTLTVHATVGAALTDEKKAAASAKNWTLVY